MLRYEGCYNDDTMQCFTCQISIAAISEIEREVYFLVLFYRKRLFVYVLLGLVATSEWLGKFVGTTVNFWLSIQKERTQETFISNLSTLFEFQTESINTTPCHSIRSYTYSELRQNEPENKEGLECVVKGEPVE